MSGLEFMVWLLLYVIQLWSLSIITMLPIIMIWFEYRGDTWRSKVAQELMPTLLRYQVTLLVMVVFILFAGKFFSLIGEFRSSYLQLYEQSPIIFQMAIVALFLATVILAIAFRNREQKVGKLRPYLLVSVILNYVFLLMFVALSTSLFTASIGHPIVVPRFEFIARLLHIVFSSLTLGGATLGFVVPELAKRYKDHAEVAARWGLRSMLVGSIIQVITGFVLLIAVDLKAYPVPIGHIMLTLSIFSAIGVVVMAGTSLGKSGSKLRIARATAIATLFTFFLMIGMRMVHLTKKFGDGATEIVQLIPPSLK